MLTSIRISHWWQYIFPPILGIIYLCFLSQEVLFEEEWLQLTLFFISFVFTASFGYFFNDLCDIEDDKKAGKQNFAEKLSFKVRFFLLFFLLIFAVLPWLFMENVQIAKYIFILQFFLLIAYSIPFIRLKQRVFAAVLTDALYSSFLPALIAFFLFYRNILEFEILIPFILFAIMLLLRGLRNIIIHQIDDAPHDRKSGISTFALKFGNVFSLKIIIAIAIAEIIGIIAFTSSFSLEISYWGAFIIPAFVLYFILKSIDAKNKNKSKLFYIKILNDFYEDIVPLTILILLSLNNYLFILLLIVHLVMFRNKFLYTLIHSFLYKSLFYAFIYRKILLWLYYNPAKWLYYKAFHNKYIKNILK